MLANDYRARMLFPESRRALTASAAEIPVWTEGYDVAAARADARRVAAEEPREEVAEVVDVDADGVPCRLYTPTDPGESVVVHAHGGGFVFNDVEVHDASARRLANRAGLRVLSVDYRLPPEHRFPAAVDDVGTAADWAARELGGSLLAHGDSAGGNLALVDALRHPGRYRAVALVYPPGTGSSTPARPTISPTPTSRRCCPTGSARCRRPWW